MKKDTKLILIVLAGIDGVRRVDPSSIKFCDEKNAVLCEMSKTP